MKQAQPNLVADGELQVMVISVVFLGQLLCLQETLAHLDQDLIMATEDSVDSFHPSHPQSVWQEQWPGTAVDHLERSSTQGGVEGGVVAVLRPSKLRMGMVSCNTVQIQGNDFVYHLGLDISLWVEGCAHTRLDTSHSEEVVLDILGKDGDPVTNNGGWKPVQADDVVEESAGDGCGGVGVECNKMRILREAVGHCEDDGLTAPSSEGPQ